MKLNPVDHDPPLLFHFITLVHPPSLKNVIQALEVTLPSPPPPSQVWINQGDIVLVGLRDFQDDKADVLLRYNPDEARNLKTYGELPEEGAC